MSALIRNYVPADQSLVDQLVRDAWSELASLMPGWPELAPRLQALTANADASEVIVAEVDGELVGAVGYVGPQQPKPDFFHISWPIVRFMSVAPQAQGRGLGRELLQACIARARRDQCALIALHTTPVMRAAQHLYRREGFEVMRELPDMYGVPYVLMVRPLND